MVPILTEYAMRNNFAVVLDVGTQQSPVLWFATATNITDTLIQLYDQQHPVKDAPAAAAPKAPPAAPPAKKQ